MKLTQTQLKQIIKEEMKKFQISEQRVPPDMRHVRGQTPSPPVPSPIKTPWQSDRPNVNPRAAAAYEERIKRSIEEHGWKRSVSIPESFRKYWPVGTVLPACRHGGRFDALTMAQPGCRRGPPNPRFNPSVVLVLDGSGSPKSSADTTWTIKREDYGNLLGRKFEQHWTIYAVLYR